VQFTLDEDQIQGALFGDRGMEVLMESVLNQVLQSEMTDHLGAAAGERTSGRSGYRNGQYERELTTRVGRLELEVPRDREGTFSTQLFDRYQRSEKALVLSLIADGDGGGAGRLDAPREKDYRPALRATLLKIYRVAAG
jgi:transposase-like protein